ncbi:Protein kinase domain-containing protein [Heracleum sosnowskyi]|uniref:non-specific serine/threonine protein kinase n=1 Tax=Heracleum sosnowskyi TaxID=360622 RepID=A0AAD8MFH4_9APIA|nr:Protein kinase domain-containing protein [Heracleum sosnowskyi]
MRRIPLFCSRSRTTFFYTIGVLVFVEDSNLKFNSSVDPLMQEQRTPLPCLRRRRRTLKNSDTKTENSLEASKGISLVPVLDKFNSLKKTAKKGNGAVIVFEYELLVAATNNFKEDNILGEGGSGRVYKVLFSGQLVVVVKRLKGGKLDAEKEFENEIAWLRVIKHQKVISLLGYCIHNETRFLVYEMMPNRSLESQLHGPSQGSTLTWNIRMKIALDIARGLEYLHERCNPPVIHRNLKSSNILLDSNFNAKVRC